MVYQGSHKVVLDAKSRIAIPADFRRQLDDQCAGAVTLTRGTDPRALWLFPRPIWLRFREKLRKLPIKYKAYRSHFLQNARDMEIDKAGRINIPMALREMTQINGSTLYVGGDGDYIELWDWDHKMGLDEELDFSQVPDSMFNWNDAPEGVDD